MATFTEEARLEADRRTMYSPEREHAWLFVDGASWAARRIVPKQEELAEVVLNELVAYVGTCVCHEAYTSRNREDPDCIWHMVGGTDFVNDTAEAILRKIKEKM